MKCVFIASDFAPKVGGIAQFMYGIISQLPPENVVAIASPTPGWKAFDKQQSFPIYRLPIRGTWAESTRHTRWMLFHFLRQLRKVPDVELVVCCHGTLTLMLAARLLKFFQGTPYGVFLHGLDILGVRTRPQWPLYKRLLQGADIVFPNSQMIEAAAAAGGVRPNRLHLIHPCVNVDELQVKTPSSQLRERLDLVNKFIILTVGRLTKAKGVDTVLQALPQVLEAIPQAHYVVLGDGPARFDLERLAREQDVSQAVTFLGAKAHQEIADFYAMSDLFVMTPHENPDTMNVESFGIVYLEANFLELPVIASRAGGITDAVKHGETGLLVPPGQPAALAQAIIALQQDLKLSQELVKNGRQRVLDQFTSAAAARQFLNVLSTHLK